ncbi:MAG: ferrochelatase [Acidobacteriota bacterium]|nr:ferrochelatase [Acidobacteriota bacterium]
MQPFDAVLLISFGGPQGKADIRPFLANVLRGRRVSSDRVEEVAHHYELFDGVSPITERTLEQATGLRDRLHRAGLALPVHVGMRNWHPYLPDTLREMADAGVRHAIGVILAAHRSYSSCEQYRRNVEAAQAEHPLVKVTYVGDWHTHDGFLDAIASRIIAAQRNLPPPVQDHARVVFTAHSIPISMARTSPYVTQLRASAEGVAERLGLRDWALVFQSRSGRPQDPWLEPDICDYLREERSRGLGGVVVCPLGFVADHVEVLYDLDHEAAAVCQELGIPMQRAAAVNDHPRFIDTLAAAVEATMRRYADATPLPLALPPEHSRP